MFRWFSRSQATIYIEAPLDVVHQFIRRSPNDWNGMIRPVSPQDDGTSTKIIMKNFLGRAVGNVEVLETETSKVEVDFIFTGFNVKEHFALSKAGHGTHLVYRLSLFRMGRPVVWLYRLAIQERIQELKSRIEIWRTRGG